MPDLQHIGLCSASCLTSRGGLPWQLQGLLMQVEEQGMVAQQHAASSMSTRRGQGDGHCEGEGPERYPTAVRAPSGALLRSGQGSPADSSAATVGDNVSVQPAACLSASQSEMEHRSRALLGVVHRMPLVACSLTCPSARHELVPILQQSFHCTTYDTPASRTQPAACHRAA